MGRHYCQMCCRSHQLPWISSAASALDVTAITASSARAACLLADLEKELPSAIELPAATSDFAEEHTLFRIVLEDKMQGGFWSQTYSAAQRTPDPPPASHTEAAHTPRPLVVKVYKEQKHMSQRQIYDRFHRELTAVGSLGEACVGVGRCVGFGFTADLWPYLVLQHCGTPLRAVLEKTRVHVPSLAQQLLEALECVHMLGLSHNDLTWDNVMLLPLPPPALAAQKTKGGGGRNAKAAGVAAAAAEHVRRQWRGERFVVRLVDWNSVEECALEGVEISGEKALVIQKASAPRTSEAECNAVIRDCQAAGSLILRCADEKLATKVLRQVNMGTLEDWEAAAALLAGERPGACAADVRRAESVGAAAAAVAAATTCSHLPDNWIQAILILIHPRRQWSMWNDKVVYPIPTARELLAASKASGGRRQRLWHVLRPP